MRSNINLHIHTIHSDGKKTVAEIVDELKAAGVEYFSITDHNQVCGNAEAAELAKKHGLGYCNGIELSCCFDSELGFNNSDSCHVLGFGIDINKMQSEQQRVRDEGAKGLRERNIPKIAEGIEIIKKCGGIAVWAHPFEIIRTVKKDASVSYEKEDLPMESVAGIAKLMSSYGIDGMEVYYQGYAKPQINFLEKLADKHNMFRSVGTDYHGRRGEQIRFEVNGVSPDVTIKNMIFQKSLEIALRGGRTTDGVVRVGDTVRRPRKVKSEYICEVLTFLHSKGFSKCPRFLGIDEQGRDVYSFIDGYVPNEIGNTTIEQLCNFMKIVKEFHDISVGFVKVADNVLCHNDLSPCNTVFYKNEPIAIIDWDNICEGERWEDVAYCLALD